VSEVELPIESGLTTFPTLPIPEGSVIEYKYTRGSYDSVEEWGTLGGPVNRVAMVHAKSPTDLTQLVDDTCSSNPNDSRKAVQNWRDALVTGTSPVASSSGSAPTDIGVTFNWDVTPDGIDFSNAIVVSRNGTPVAGAITHDSSTHSLHFTPSTTLAGGMYTVTVDHVVPVTVGSDGIKILAPYTFTFKVS